MALVIETGAGIAAANSYVSLTDAQAFLAARDLDVTLTEGLLLRGMDQLNTIQLNGTKASASNPLPMPRSGMYDCDDVLIASDAIPSEIIAAQIWIAFYIAQGSDPAAVAEAAIKREKVDVIETEYAINDGGASAITPLSLPNVRNALRCLAASSNGGVAGGGFIDRV